MSETFAKGQRWISSTEPDLGLGIVAKITADRISVEFPAADKFRLYAPEASPLKRVRFRNGEEIETRDGRLFRVESQREVRNVILYCGEGLEVPETELSDTLSFSAPLDRLLGGQMDEPEAFCLRHDTLRFRAKWLTSPVRGFLGARMDLIPHQLYVAHETATRRKPRVLLADEVGLGKTIEAGLILHHLLLANRVERCLIIVPEPLVHQWFVELYRRFHISPHIFDEERCRAIDQELKRARVRGAEANPFLQSQCVLCSLDFALDKKRQPKLLAGEWDIVIIDEAHHLEWAPKSPSPAYEFAEKLVASIDRVLLLTGTPEQLGPEGHFARLRLLDPNRYRSLTRFLKERKHYEEVAEIAQQLAGKESLSSAQLQKLESLFGHYTKKERSKLLKALEKGRASARHTLLRDLVDQHGPGRVLFRNRRIAMQGFPGRKAELIPLKPGREGSDSVVSWLVGYCRQILESGEKALLITQSVERVEALKEAIASEVNLKMAVFHEQLTLLQRDRNAAWFAEEDGAQLLLCSEIGSEGRNFQFAHRLVLIDLPLNPYLLEQRIGRLDRIGQNSVIQIHVPYVQGSADEVLARWYHEGMNAFEECIHGGDLCRRELGAQVCRLHGAAAKGSFNKSKLDLLVDKTRKLHEKHLRVLEKGRDALLEMTSCNADAAMQLAEAIREFDADPEFENYFVRLMDHFGVSVEPLGERTYFLRPDNLYTDAFPEIPYEGMTVTLDRATALSREDYQFVTWDHPLIQGAVDLLLGSEQGNASFGYVEIDEEKMLFLEALYVLECISPGNLHVERFYPPTPIRALVNHRHQDLSDIFTPEEVARCFRPGKARWLQKNSHILQTIVPTLNKLCRKLVDRQATQIRRRSSDALRRTMTKELERIRHLHRLNDHVGEEEVSALESEMEAMKEAGSKTRVRLDGLRVLFKEDD